MALLKLVLIPRWLLLLALTVVAAPAVHAADKPPTQVIVATASLLPFADRIEALGTLRANESVALTAAVADTVSAIHFNDGDRVSKGQVLVEMTSQEETALLEEARATAGEAARQYRRVASLESQGTAAKSLLDERRRDSETAKARLTVIESRLQDRVIKAPFAGVVGLRDLSVGALVEPGDLITTLDDDSVMKLEFQVPSTFLEVLRPGLTIEASAKAFPGRQFDGQVSAVDSRVDPATRSIRVRAQLPNKEGLLKPGMLMQLVLLKQPRDALVIPEEALLPLGDKQFVLLVEESDQTSKAVRREIQIGGRRPGQVEVLEGLQPGDRVITQGGIKLRPGESVVVSAVDDGSQPLAELIKPAGSDQP